MVIFGVTLKVYSDSDLVQLGNKFDEFVLGINRKADLIFVCREIHAL